MKKTLVLIALLLAACNEQSANVWQSRPAAEQAERVVFIGDSITYYWRLEDYFKNTANVGIGGQTSVQMLERFETDVISKAPTTLVILAGTNDIRLLESGSTQNLFEMVTRAQAAGARVIVGTLPPNENWFSDPVLGHALYKQMNAEIRAGSAIYGYTIAEYNAAMVLPDGSINTELFDWDLVHPNASGYDVMAKVLAPLLGPKLLK